MTNMARVRKWLWPALGFAVGALLTLAFCYWKSNSGYVRLQSAEGLSEEDLARLRQVLHDYFQNPLDRRHFTEDYKRRLKTKGEYVEYFGTTDFHTYALPPGGAVTMGTFKATGKTTIRESVGPGGGEGTVGGESFDSPRMLLLTIRFARADDADWRIEDIEYRDP